MLSCLAIALPSTEQIFSQLALDSWSYYSEEQGLTAQQLPLSVGPNGIIKKEAGASPVICHLVAGEFTQ